MRWRRSPPTSPPPSPTTGSRAATPFLTMCSVAVCGWLMERQDRAATDNDDFARMKQASARFYLDQIVPEALGLKAAAMASAEILYAVEAEAFAA